jgi:hypothetical protein
LLKCDPKDIFSLISISTIKETQESYSYYKYDIFLALEASLRKEEKLQPSNIDQKRKKGIPRTQSLKEDIVVQIQANNQVNFTKKIHIEHQAEQKNFQKEKQKSQQQKIYDEAECISTNQNQDEI